MIEILSSFVIHKFPNYYHSYIFPRFEERAWNGPDFKSMRSLPDNTITIHTVATQQTKYTPARYSSQRHGPSSGNLAHSTLKCVLITDITF